MTDNEIIKALGHCTNINGCGTDCPCFSENEDTCGDYNGFLKQCLDLINRQNAEIDILIRKNETLKDEVSELQLKNAELQHSCDVVHSVKNQYKDILKTANAKNRDLEEAFTKFVDDGYNIRTEAIKEFGERLKAEYIFALLKDGSVRKIIPNYAIDYVVKEMVGDAE